MKTTAPRHHPAANSADLDYTVTRPLDALLSDEQRIEFLRTRLERSATPALTARFWGPS